jgi:hypothetical protein
LCGAGFTDVVIRAFFGFRPCLDDQRMLWVPEQPRGFSGQLRHVRWGKAHFTIQSTPTGLSTEKE